MVQEDRTKCNVQNCFQNHREEETLTYRGKKRYVINTDTNKKLSILGYCLFKHISMLILMLMILFTCLVALHRIL